MKSYGISKRGLVRPTNEDKFHIQEPSLYIVADGMGGHIGGEIASGLAIDSVCQYLHENTSEWTNEVTLCEAILHANKKLRSEIGNNPNLEGMGTTLLLLYLENTIAFWAHVGDSRLYNYYRGTLNQITADHSLVTELIEEGKITEEEAAVHPSRHVITRSVGTMDELEVDSGRFQITKETMLLMCTDGLSNMLGDEAIRNIMIANERDAESCAKDLLTATYDAGAKDNVTIVTIAI